MILHKMLMTLDLFAHTKSRYCKVLNIRRSESRSDYTDEIGRARMTYRY